MNAVPPDTNTVCPARIGTDQPWSTAEVSFGVRSLVVQPLDVAVGAMWVPYEDVISVDELTGDGSIGGGVPDVREIEAVLRDGRTLALQLDQERLDALLVALAASKAGASADLAGPVTPALFGIGDDEPRSASPASPASPVAPAGEDVIDVSSGLSSSPTDSSAGATATGSATSAPWPEYSPPPAGSPPPSSPNPDTADRRRRLVVGLAAAVVLLIVGVGLVVLVGGGDDDPGPVAQVGGTATTADTEPSTAPTSAAVAPTSTAAPTTATPGGGSLASLQVEATDVVVIGNASGRSIYASFDIENNADQAVTAFRLTLTVSSDGGGVDWLVPLSCSAVPVEPGDRLSGSYSDGDAAVNAPQFANCSIAGWPVDPANTSQTAVADASAAGAEVRASVEVVSVTFADGTTATADGVD